MDLGHGELCIGQWIRGECRLGIVPKISDKSLAVLQFNLKSLIIDGRPLSLDHLRLVALLCASTAVARFSLIVISYFNFDYFFLSKCKLVGPVNDLYLIWHLMRAYIIHLEQVNRVYPLADVECPITVDILSEAMHWLVCLHRIIGIG